MGRLTWSTACVVVIQALTISFTSAQFIYAGCDVSSAVVKLPTDQSTLEVPSTAPNSIALAIGFQNYTCGSDGKYSSAGAIAELYDISCLLQTNGTFFDTVQDTALGVWSNSGLDLKSLASVDKTLKETWSLDIHLGTHFLIATSNPPGYNFDYRAASRQGIADGSVMATASATLPSPGGAQNLPWLSLDGKSGGLAKTILMVDTLLGQPPESCEAGSGSLLVKYTAKYWFFGGSPSPLVDKYKDASSAWSKATAIIL